METGSLDASHAVALDARRRNLLVWRLSAVAGFTGVLFGYDISAINDAVVFMQRRFALSSLDRGVVVSALLLGALVGALGAGKLADTWGRRRSVVVAGLAAAAGALMAGLAVNVPMLLAGRLIIGLGVGVTSAIAPLYIAELAPARSRGSMVALYQMSITLGILAALAVGVAFTPTANWRIMIAAGAVPAIAQVLAMAIVPESPRYLVARGRVDAARRVLARLRPAGDVDHELDDIAALHRATAGARYRDVFGRAARPALIIGVGAALMNALVGVGAVIYYSTDIFHTAGVGSAELASLAVGAVNTVMTIVAIFLIARFGRRPLLLVGLTGIVMSLVVAGVALVASAPGWIAVVGLIGFIACFAISAGPIAWVIVAEVFPLAIRGRAASFATSTNWAANFVLALAFPLFVGTPGVSERVGVAFFIYAAISVGLIVFVARLVPETKDRTLEQIEADLSVRV
jgi:sugar porter (SP) family MFS transporter